MKFEEIDFYDYKIRMCLDNGIRMYLVSDLLRQYNEKHRTNKRFKHYLENKQTQELLRKRCEKTDRGNSDHQSNEDQNVKIDIPDVIQYIKTSSRGMAQIAREIHFLPNNRGNPFSTIFGHFLPLPTWPPRWP